VELALGLGLLLGLLTRLAGIGGFLWQVNIAVGAFNVPGEWYSPTQPFPTKPPAFDNQGISSDSLINFTPELHAEAEKLVSKYRIGPLFTPPSVSNLDGPLATIASPGALGGANWPGGSYDPDTHTLYVYSQSGIATLGLVPSPDPKFSDMEYVQGTAGVMPRPGRPMGAPPPATRPATAAVEGGEGGDLGPNVRGLPLLKPPYGRITAINLDKGEFTWQIAHGETPDNVRNNPALNGLNIPRTGRAGLVGTLTTKTLIIAGEAGFFTTPSGDRGAMLRAYDKATGDEVGAVFMPAPQSGSPMTYMLDGRQYIVVAVSGGSYPGEYIAFRLPADAH